MHWETPVMSFDAEDQTALFVKIFDDDVGMTVFRLVIDVTIPTARDDSAWGAVKALYR